MERPRAVVVAVDPARLDLYARTLRIAQIPSRATLDLDEAAELLTTVQPSVLVLDHGLPRLYILRLYGMVRGPVEGPRVKVLFVGQDGVEGPDDYYLPGEPSPLGVAAQVGEMVAEADEASAARAAVATDDAQTDAAVAEREPQAETYPAPVPDERAAQIFDEDDREAELAGVGVASAGPGTPPAATSEIPAPPVESRPPPKRRRFDVLMFRIGMVLLIIGGLLAFIRPESFTLPMSPPPTVVPAAPTPVPGASPSPAALVDDAALWSRLVERPR